MRSSLSLLAVLLALAACQPAYAGGVSGAPGTLDATLVDPPTSVQYPHVIVSGTPAVGGTVAVSNLPGTVDTGPGAAGASTQRVTQATPAAGSNAGVPNVGILQTGTQVSASNTAANGTAQACLAAHVGAITYVTGFSITAGGATSASLVAASLTLNNGALYYQFGFPAGPTVAATPLIVELSQPVPAGPANTATCITLPAGGAGNTAATVNIHGFWQ